jgi:isoleucyl-tRNA synthetase
MKGHHVVRRFGWDTHGVPIEYEIDQKLGISGKDAVAQLGIGKYNEECRSIVMKYASEWRQTIERLGRWVDFDNDYKVYQPSPVASPFSLITDNGLHVYGIGVVGVQKAIRTGRRVSIVSDHAIFYSIEHTAEQF